MRESSSLAGVLGPVDTVGVLGVAAEPILRTPADIAARLEPDAETGVGNDGVLEDPGVRLDLGVRLGEGE